MAEVDNSASLESAVHHHMRVGWTGMLVFVTLGTALEMLHAIKVPGYLGVGNETRRLMWTLAHAHGVGLSLIHIGLAATLKSLFGELPPRFPVASRLLTWGTVWLPGGFLLGGVVTYQGDPGIGIWLVPVGALSIWVAIFLVVRAVTGRQS